MKDSKMMLILAGIGVAIAAAMMLFKVDEKVQDDTGGSRSPIKAAAEQAVSFVSGAASWFGARIDKKADVSLQKARLRDNRIGELTTKMVTLADGTYTAATNKVIATKDYVGEKYTMFKTGVVGGVKSTISKIGGWFGR